MLPEFWLGFIAGAMVAAALLSIWYGRQLDAHRKTGEQLERRGVEIQERLKQNAAQLLRLQAQADAGDAALRELSVGVQWKGSD